MKTNPNRFVALMFQRPWRFAGVVLLVLGVVAGSLWFFLRPAKAPDYLSATVKHGDIEDSVLASGVLQPIRQVDVGAQVSGQLKTLKVKLGQRVEKDQLLAEIDPQLARSDLQIAQADLTGLLAEQRGKEARLGQAQDEFARQQTLRTGGASSQREWQHAKAELQAASADRDELAARISKARYIIAQQQTKLTYTRITAPMMGEVLKIDTKEGQTVISAQQAPKILTLGDLSRIEVWAEVSEADIARIRPGLRAYFYLLGTPEQRHVGVVREIQPTPEKINNAMFYYVLFEVDNPDRSLRVNMTAQVGIVIAEQRNTLMVPLTALSKPEADGRYLVKVLPAKGAPLERKVRIGLKSRTHAEVLDGLKLGEQVITDPPEEPASGVVVSVG